MFYVFSFRPNASCKSIYRAQNALLCYVFACIFLISNGLFKRSTMKVTKQVLMPLLFVVWMQKDKNIIQLQKQYNYVVTEYD